jgi:hypothetical protein
LFINRGSPRLNVLGEKNTLAICHVQDPILQTPVSQKKSRKGFR